MKVLAYSVDVSIRDIPKSPAILESCELGLITKLQQGSMVDKF